MAARTKTCYRCKKSLTLERFSVNRAKRDGLSPYCRRCASLSAKENRARTRGAAGKGTPWRGACPRVAEIFEEEPTARVDRVTRALEELSERTAVECAQ